MIGTIRSKRKNKVFSIVFFILTLLLLNLTNPLGRTHADVEIRFRFDEHLCDAASWTAGAPGGAFAILPCPGGANDSSGFVRPVANTTKLEGGIWAERSFETHPMWQTDGWIMGTFSLSRMGIVLIETDHLVGKVGLLEGANSGRVKFTIQYDQNPIEPGGVILLFEREDTYDARLIDFDIDLSPYAGQNGDIILKVDALGAASQDWAVWSQVRIQNSGIPPVVVTTVTPTRTRSITPTQSRTITPSLTPTGSVTPTRTVTPTVTLTPPPILTTEPPVIATTKKPCACFENQVLDVHFSGNDGFAIGRLIRGSGAVLLTVSDEKASGDNGLFTIMDANGVTQRTFEARFTPNDVIVVGDVWGDDGEEEILVGIDEDHKVYVYNSVGILLETKSIPYTRYDILAVGDVLDDVNSVGDEIIFASDEHDNFIIYPRSGPSRTISLDWNFDGASVPGIKSEAHTDALTTGNVFGDDREEILFVDQQSEKSVLYYYDGSGSILARATIRFTGYDALATGNVLGNDYAEVIVGIDEDRAFYLLDPLIGILKMHHGRVTPVDVIAVADVTGEGKDDIFLAVDDDSKIYIYYQE